MKEKTIHSIKIVIIAIVSILIAEYFNLNFSVSTGVVAILSIATNKSDTIKTALIRFVAFIIAIIIGLLCFSIFGYTLHAFFVYLVIYIPFCKWRNYDLAMAMNTVLISHFLTTQNMAISTIANEFYIFFIGVGLGVLSNLHLSKDHYQIKLLKQQTDDKIKKLLLRMSIRIQDTNIDDFDGSCFESLNHIATNALEVTKLNMKNQFNSKDTYDFDYVLMRQKQIQVLHQMYKHIYDIDEVAISAKYIGDCLENISKQYHSDNDVASLIEDVTSLKEDMKDLPMPIDRKEFEQRAKLFILIQEIEELLLIKNEFMYKYSPKNT